VVQYMIRGLQFPPDHMGAIGYGQFHPIVPNDTNEHRSMNRRVVFFVKNNPAKVKPEKESGKDKSVKEEAAPAAEAAAPDQAASSEQAAPTEEASATNPIPDSTSQPATPNE
jgi:hypothetical protein